MMTVDPTTVRMTQRIAAGKFRINGVALAPAEKTIAWGRKIVDYRAEATVAALRKVDGHVPATVIDRCARRDPAHLSSHLVTATGAAMMKRASSGSG